MSESSFKEISNPATQDYNRLERDCGQQMKMRKIGSGGIKSDLGQVFQQSLLGDRLSGYQVDENSLCQYEKELRSKPDVRIQTIVDFDGVLVSPIHLQKKAGLSNMLWLARVAKASDNTIVWTRRFQPEKGRLSDYALFPFLGKGVSERITNAMKHQGEVNVMSKNANNNGDLLVNLTGNSDLTIFIGSGNLDRKIVNEYLEKGGDPKKLVYFDTGHLIL